MNTTPLTPYQELRQAWKAQALARPRLALCFIGCLSLIFISLLITTYQGLQLEHFNYALLGGLAGFTGTSLGALCIFFISQMRTRIQDGLLGFAAGMMLAASAFSLILPGLAAAEGIFGQPLLAAATVVLGLALGTVIMLGLDYFTPHEHASIGRCGPECQRISGLWLFVFAIALHNLPEGMAIGISFTHGDLKIGLPLTLAIAIQDIPEGLAVALALYSTGLSHKKSFLIAAATGLLEPLGAILGFGMSSSLALAYPISMGLAAGAMIFVVSHEVIPETHRNGHQTSATLGLMIGFAVMMFLDTALG